MKFLFVNSDNIIENIIECDDIVLAKKLNAILGYDGANIGELYIAPPEPLPEPTQLDRIEAQITYTALMTDTLIKEG